MPNHCFHVMHYYDHLAGNIEEDHPYAYYDWPEAAQDEYDRVFNLSVVYGQLAHADVITTPASGATGEDWYEHACR